MLLRRRCSDGALSRALSHHLRLLLVVVSEEILVVFGLGTDCCVLGVYTRCANRSIVVSSSCHLRNPVVRSLRVHITYHCPRVYVPRCSISISSQAMGQILSLIQSQQDSVQIFLDFESTFICTHLEIGRAHV